ncbi:hypothetical protein SCHPADRAFT_943276 [Schizopora paradoxa]|uniref:Uncharacterized protein n=1 Tax=Schizopora paradoxa TaxID=27342 RepID=A0A0H2RK81_9AGAM|nr:hypothetical protein SCHPADRAFT_943276 [Schizopora paradoxa]
MDVKTKLRSMDVVVAPPPELAPPPSIYTYIACRDSTSTTASDTQTPTHPSNDDARRTSIRPYITSNDAACWEDARRTSMRPYIIDDAGLAIALPPPETQRRSPGLRSTKESRTTRLAADVSLRAPSRRRDTSLGGRRYVPTTLVTALRGPESMSFGDERTARMTRAQRRYMLERRSSDVDTSLHHRPRARFGGLEDALARRRTAAWIVDGQPYSPHGNSPSLRARRRRRDTSFAGRRYVPTSCWMLSPSLHLPTTAGAKE